MIIGLLRVAAQHHLVDLELGVARIQNADFVHHHAVLDAPVRALNKPVIIDARKARQRTDQTDVRTFRRLNRADAPVVRRMHVANFESRSLSRETSWSKSRQTPLMRNLA